MVWGQFMLATLLLGSAAPAVATPWSERPNRVVEAQYLAQASPSVSYRLLFVNPLVGDDAGDGSLRSPLRSITRALQQAEPGTVILLSGGTYSSASGEQFPLMVPSGVTLVEDPSAVGQSVVIQGEVQGSDVGVQRAIAPPAPRFARPGEGGGTGSAAPARAAAPQRQFSAPRRASSAPPTTDVSTIAPAAAAPQRQFSAARRQAAAAPAPAVAVTPRQPDFSTPIEIPVPRPENPGVARPMPIPPPAPATASRPDGLPQLAPSPLPDFDRLPVPSQPAPTGFVGDTPTVSVPRVMANSATMPQMPVPSRATSLGLRYRVVVRTRDEAEQIQVRRVVPDAFPSYSGGAVVMQIGVFNSRSNAQEAVNQLARSGVGATIEDLFEGGQGGL